MLRVFRAVTVPRTVLVPLILVALGAPSGLIAGQAASALAGAPATHTAASSMAGMDMSAAPSLARTKTVKMLHRKVIQITINNFAFSPASVEVSPGTKIIWTNHDSDPHTVDSTKNVWTSEALDTDGRFTRVFKKTGAFPYYCSIHPFMHAAVIVVK
ncbi:MAG TPA: cupredoxin domain-containing protein [Chloroflexota bacterium]|nr:cupredoxin domain-containing protein [Chloroflexota bacterium]